MTPSINNPKDLIFFKYIPQILVLFILLFVGNKVFISNYLCHITVPIIATILNVFVN